LSGTEVTHEKLGVFHRSHAGGPGAYSPCMHRRDAKTVSFSRITVTSSAVRFVYTPAAPCEDAPAEMRQCSLNYF
jgi:hypothetical protein